jgi:hypothetical protein
MELDSARASTLALASLIGVGAAVASSDQAHAGSTPTQLLGPARGQTSRQTSHEAAERPVRH